MNNKPTPIDESKLLPKILGGDYELTNFIEGETEPSDEAADAILAEIDGVPAFRGLKPFKWPVTAKTKQPRSTVESLVDHGRKYLANGGCVYIDSTHLELAFPESRSAAGFVHAHRAMLDVAVAALKAANLRRDPEDGKIRLLAGNSDGRGQAWGTHLDFLISRDAFTNVMDRRLHYQAFLASVHAAGVLFGQGKVGAENHPPIAYQISQRVPDFFSKVATLDTMCGAHRGLVNTRDEALAGKRSAEFARYHCIPYDHTLNRYSDWLKVGHLQLVLSMIEAERVPYDLILEDPPKAAHDWGRDQTLYDDRSKRVSSEYGRARARLITGEWITLAAYHARLAERAGDFFSGAPELIGSVVPDAEAILHSWAETAARLEAGDTAWLARRFDAWTKRNLLVEAMSQDSTLGWDSPRLKALDHLYGELPDGLFFLLERAGEVETSFPGANSELAQTPYAAPRDTRAGVRAKLLGILPRKDIVRVNWDEIVFEGIDPATGRTRVFNLPLSDPAMQMPPFWDALSDPADLAALSTKSVPPQPPPLRTHRPGPPRLEERHHDSHSGRNAGPNPTKINKQNQSPNP
jgi:hypothetical protein